MTKAFRNSLVLSSLLFCAIWVTAQTYPAQSSSQSSNQTGNSETKVQGCLSGSNGNYTLTSDSGTAYQLGGDTSTLSEHVGHKVEITGTTNTASTGSTNPSTPSSSGTGAQPTLNVSSIKHISSTCK